MKPIDLAVWCAAVLLASVQFPHTVALRLLMLVAGTTLVAVELARCRLRGVPFEAHTLPPLLLPFVIWGAWAALSLTWSIEPARSLKEFKNEIGYTLVAFWLCYVTAQTRGASRVLITVVAVAAAAACAAGIFGFWHPTSLLQQHGLLFVGPGNQSSALLTLMPGALLGAWLAATLERPRVLWASALALAVLFLISAYTTLNRTVWIGFSIQLIVIGALLVPRLRRSGFAPGVRGKLALGLLAVAVLVVGLGAMLAVQRERFGPHLERTLDRDPRLQVWAAAAGIIEEHPWTGLGFGRGIERHLLQADFPARYHENLLWHAHNLLLEAGVETGLPGMGLLILLLATTAYQGWKLAREPDLVAAACGTALIAVVAGMLVRNMTDVLWVRQNSLLYWGIVGLLLGWGRRRQRSRS